MRHVRTVECRQCCWSDSVTEAPSTAVPTGDQTYGTCPKCGGFTTADKQQVDRR